MSVSIIVGRIVGDRRLGRFGGLKHLFHAIPTSRIVRFIFIVAAGAWYGLGVNAAAAQSLPGTPRFSVVVLPFANLSGDPMQGSLADAISSKLTSALARLRGSRVVEHSTAAAYKDQAVNAKAIREEPGVRLALKGSVQTTGDNTKISAELIDSESGARLWDDEFEVPRAGSFQMQDRIAARLTRGIYLQLPQIETAQFERTRASTPNAEDLAVECQASVLRNEIVFIQSNTACDRALAPILRTFWL